MNSRLKEMLTNEETLVTITHEEQTLTVVYNELNGLRWLFSNDLRMENYIKEYPIIAFYSSVIPYDNNYILNIARCGDLGELDKWNPIKKRQLEVFTPIIQKFIVSGYPSDKEKSEEINKALADYRSFGNKTFEELQAYNEALKQSPEFQRVWPDANREACTQFLMNKLGKLSDELKKQLQENPMRATRGYMKLGDGWEIGALLEDILEKKYGIIWYGNEAKTLDPDTIYE